MSLLDLFNIPREPNSIASVCVCTCGKVDLKGERTNTYNELKETSMLYTVTVFVINIQLILSTNLVLSCKHYFHFHEKNGKLFFKFI